MYFTVFYNGNAHLPFPMEVPQVRQEFGSPAGLVNQEFGSPVDLVNQEFGSPAVLVNQGLLDLRKGSISCKAEVGKVAQIPAKSASQIVVGNVESGGLPD